jgi:exopolysaccharide biosynthesis polyprenyl glycosylphosphotransferase
MQPGAGDRLMRQRNSTTLAAAIDSLVALAIVVAAVAWANQRRMPEGGLREFLEMRVTLLNSSFSIVFAVLWKECLEKLGLYRDNFTELLRPTLRSATGCGIMAGLLALYLEARHAKGPVVPVVVAFFVTALAYEMMRVFISSPGLRWKIGDMEQVIIVGSGRRAAKAWRELRIQHFGRKHLLGFVDDRDPSLMAPDIASRYLGRIDELPHLFLNNVVDELLVAVPSRSCYDLAQQAISLAESAGARIVCLNDSYQLIHSKALRLRSALFLELVPKDDKHAAAESLKRALDIFVSASGLVLLSPAFLLIALAVKATSPGPVFFVQERYGYRRRRFQMWKFRSMVANAPDLMSNLEAKNEASGPIFKIKNDPRITPLGRFLRRTSLDELPQLWNVLLGDMSLVGPRPMSTRDVSRFEHAQLMRRFSVRPGITGMWQVVGRGSLSFDQWISLDFTYIDQWSFVLDLKILVRTVPAVLKRSGAA